MFRKFYDGEIAYSIYGKRRLSDFAVQCKAWNLRSHWASSLWVFESARRDAAELGMLYVWYDRSTWSFRDTWSSHTVGASHRAIPVISYASNEGFLWSM